MLGVSQFLCCCWHRACLTTLYTGVGAVQAGISLLTSRKQAISSDVPRTFRNHCCILLLLPSHLWGRQATHCILRNERLHQAADPKDSVANPWQSLDIRYRHLYSLLWQLISTAAKIATHGCIMVHLFWLRPSDPLSFRKFSVKYLICINGTSCHPSCCKVTGKLKEIITVWLVWVAVCCKNGQPIKTIF